MDGKQIKGYTSRSRSSSIVMGNLHPVFTVDDEDEFIEESSRPQTSERPARIDGFVKHTIYISTIINSLIYC